MSNDHNDIINFVQEHFPDADINAIKQKVETWGPQEFLDASSYIDDFNKFEEAGEFTDADNELEMLRDSLGIKEVKTKTFKETLSELDEGLGDAVGNLAGSLGSMAKGAASAVGSKVASALNLSSTPTPALVKPNASASVTLDLKNKDAVNAAKQASPEVSKVIQNAKPGQAISISSQDEKKINDALSKLPTMQFESEESGMSRFRNTYGIGDRVITPQGPGRIVRLSKDFVVNGRVRVKLDEPENGGEDYTMDGQDTFTYDTTQLKHINEGKRWADEEDNDYEDDRKNKKEKSKRKERKERDKEKKAYVEEAAGRVIGFKQSDDLARILTLAGTRPAEPITELSEKAADDIDMTGKKCKECGKGKYQETSINDDRDGLLHCTKCGDSTKRWAKKVNEDHTPGEARKCSKCNGTGMEGE